ncbi:MAG: RHS repeat-associated core domain-containing protein, partial [Verrucomicrobiota bacterium]
RLVVTNVYDNFGRVVVQYTQGDTNKAWSILWSGWQTVEQDPAGSKRRFFYDDKTRPIGQQDALGNLTQTFYDGQDHVVATVSALNETNQFAYDGNHNLIYRIDPLGFTNQFVYDNQNNLVQTNDARGNPSRFGYNAQFSLTGFTNGAGQWVAYGYNSDGTLHTRADSAGTTTYGYDSYGQLNSIAYPGGFGTEGFLNSALGDMLSHTNPRLFVTSFQYNQRRELTNTIAPTNLTVSITYDSVGNVQARKDARGFSTTSTWSPTRKLLTTTFPATPQGVPVITSVYDNRDWLTQTLDPLQQPTLYTNDPAHNAISTTDPLLRTILFGYDADGRKTATTNAIREVTLQQWNARGDLAKVTDAATHTVLRQYYGAGNQIILTNRNGKQWQFQFDGANRLTNTISPLNRQTQVSFNDRGLVWTVREPSGQMTTNSYDARGRLTNRVDGVASTVYAYDADNNMTNVVENGKTNSWAFDAYDRVSSYRDADGNVIQYRYDANGNLINLIYPGNRTVSYFYDSLNRLTNVTDWANRKTYLTYDLANRLTSITRPNGSQRIINYDAAGEVTNIVEQTALKYPIAFSALNWTNIGQVGWEFAAPLPHAATLPTRTMTYDDDDRLKTFNGQTVVNDPDGNMTTGPLMTNTLASYTYDARNRLLNAGGISYGYDPAGNRTSMTNGATVTTYVINPNAKLPQVLMRIQGGVTNYYVYGAGLLYQVTETGATATTLTYHYDYRGSTVALTDDTGNITDRIEYSAYATITYRTGTSDTPFLFNGRYGVMTDPNGLLYMRARFYNPYICRFVNADPSGFAGGLNFYAYANGNPVSYIDPFGLRGFIDRLSQFLRGVGATAGGAALILVSEGPWAVATVPTGAVGVTYGIGNMVAAFAMDANDELALRMEGAPSSPAQIGGYLVAGENGQVVVGVIEAGIDVANTANSGKLLDRIKSLVDFLDAANDMNTLLNKY